MSVNSHIQSLQLKHQKLEEELHDAYLHHASVAEIKKEKLRIKDEIEGLLEHAQGADYSDDYRKAA